MSVRNIAILAHIDAGKTTLSERMLYITHAIRQMGNVDEGLSTMDYLEEEQKRGITIKAGVAHYEWKKSYFTLIDTPGHLDFGSEVDAAILGAEGSLIIVSSTSGIESQTQEAWKKIWDGGLTPVIYINKLDLPGLPLKKILEDIQNEFKVTPFLMTLPVYRDSELNGVIDVLNKCYLQWPGVNIREFSQHVIEDSEKEAFDEAWVQMMDAATEQDSELTTAYLKNEELAIPDILKGLQKTMATRKYIPVYVGSALNGMGVRQLLNGLYFFVPNSTTRLDPECLLQAMQIKHFPGLGDLCIAKLHQNVELPNPYIDKFYRLQANEFEEKTKARAGDVLAMRLNQPYRENARVGSILKKNAKEWSTPKGGYSSYLPLIQASLEPMREEDYSKLDTVLKRLIRQDPSLKLGTDPKTGAWVVSAMGEVHLDVLANRLQKLSDIEVKMGQPRVTLYERLTKTFRGLQNRFVGENVDILIEMDIFPKKSWEILGINSDNVELSEEARQVVESVLTQFSEKGISGKGPLKGLVLNLKKIEFSGDSHRFIPSLHKCLWDCLNLNLTPENIAIYEPIVKVYLTVPNQDCGKVLQDLDSRGGEIKGLESVLEISKIICEIPLQKIFNYSTLLRSLSKGQGSYYLKYLKHGLVQ